MVCFMSQSVSQNLGQFTPQPTLFLLEKVIFLYSLFSLAILWCSVVSAFPIQNDTLSFLGKLITKLLFLSFSDMALESLRASRSFMCWSTLSSFLFSKLVTYKTNNMIYMLTSEVLGRNFQRLKCQLKHHQVLSIYCAFGNVMSFK